jgi:hypothetical protein
MLLPVLFLICDTGFTGEGSINSPPCGIIITNLFTYNCNSKFYWKPYFWSDYYFVATVSNRTHTAVQKYKTNPAPSPA